MVNLELFASHVSGCLAKLFFATFGQLVGRVPERHPPWDPGDVRFVHIEVLNELQVPWDPGVHSILMATSACGQADSQGGRNVMTLAIEKPVGQSMTWAGVSNGLGLVGAAGL